MQIRKSSIKDIPILLHAVSLEAADGSAFLSV